MNDPVFYTVGVVVTWIFCAFGVTCTFGLAVIGWKTIKAKMGVTSAKELMYGD